MSDPEFKIAKSWLPALEKGNRAIATHGYCNVGEMRRELDPRKSRFNLPDLTNKMIRIVEESPEHKYAAMAYLDYFCVVIGCHSNVRDFVADEYGVRWVDSAEYDIAKEQYWVKARAKLAAQLGTEIA